MSGAADVIYFYDGSFDGLMCCVFESYEKKEIPVDIVGPHGDAAFLFAARRINTDEGKARRVLRAIPQKISQEAYDFVRYAFLTYLKKKEFYILLFLRKGFRIGPSVMGMLADNIVHKLSKAVGHLFNEAHLLKGFIRFAEINRVLVGVVAPKNCVLPLLVEHFSQRYPEERFVIYDETHRMALVYEPGQALIVPLETLELPQADQRELDYQELWRLFHRTVEIKERRNPACQMSLMPKRYWAYMTEFAKTPDSVSRLERRTGTALLEGVLPENPDGV